MTDLPELPLLYHDTCHHRIYALSCEEFDALREYAGGQCQICGLPEREAKRGRLVIDHLGSYGFHMVRGLLCDRCNMLMRRVDENRERRIPTEVYEYRYNAWCARKVDPKGMNIRYRLPGLPGARGKGSAA